MARIWCEDAEDKKKIMKNKEEWEKKGVAMIEEWLSIRERKARFEAVEEIKRVARKAGLKIQVKEERSRSTEVREKIDKQGQNWRLREWRGDRARENR